MDDAESLSAWARRSGIEPVGTDVDVETGKRLTPEECGETFYGHIPSGVIDAIDYSVPRTCRLPEGHDGPHDITRPDSEYDALI